MNKAMLIAAAGVIAVIGGTAPSEAKSGVRKDKAKPHSYRAIKVERSDPNDPSCILAESLDPGGTYSAYPCWARAALAPKGDGKWR